MTILAIDQGTTSTRVLCVEADGSNEITAAFKHRQIYPQAGWVEHDADELVQNIERCIEASPDASAIGIDNQGESCLAWHADSKQALSPVIVWQDNRTHAVIDGLKADGCEARVLEIAGLPLDPYFSASKLAWLLQHNDAVADAQAAGKLRMGTTDAYFLDRLSGHFVTDITTASRTSLLNLETGDWDAELCDLFGVPLQVLPRIVTTTGNFGAISQRGRPVPVTASVVDQQASLYGHGCRHSGDAKITFGTGAFALAVTGEQLQRSPEQGLLPTVGWQFDGRKPVYALDGGVYCAGSAIEWGRNLGLFESYDEINRFETPAAIERDLVFVPALSGLACPHWDRTAAGLWLGMSLDTSRRDLAQALLEGVALRAAEVIRAIDGFASIGERLSIDGGVSANPYFCQFLADVLGREVSVNAMAEVTALGAAMLAAGDSPIHVGADSGRVNYHPDADRGALLERFREAVKRSQHWRR